jgi:aconitate hydratase 2/2-methylisocitrate dehydratase
MVNAIPYRALELGLLTVAKQNKKNVFSGRIIEIEGLQDLRVEQAFELSDATAERSAAGCTVRLGTAPVIEYLRSNVVMLRWLIANGYEDKKSLERRARAMERWLEKPELLQPDADARYHTVIEIDMDQITEPIVACPNDPDDVKLLSAVAGTAVSEVFLGSCMTNIGHFRAAGRLLKAFGDTTPTRLWVAPPTKMDKEQLMAEGYYSIYAAAGARTEVPGCSLCMGNQARVMAGATVVSTSTRNFPNRLGKGANVFLASAEVAAVTSMLGKLPTLEQYRKYAGQLDPVSSDVYRYLNFDQMPAYTRDAQRAASLPIVS